MDPVHYFDASRDAWDPLDGATTTGWYFWCETWADRVGPFPTAEIAQMQLKEYCAQL